MINKEYEATYNLLVGTKIFVALDKTRVTDLRNLPLSIRGCFDYEQKEIPRAERRKFQFDIDRKHNGYWVKRLS